LFNLNGSKAVVEEYKQKYGLGLSQGFEFEAISL